MKYDKLVRDKIPAIIEKSGKKAITRTLNDDEYKIYLEKKLDEEVAEFHESKDFKEIADIIEVLYAICSANGYSIGSVNTELALKRGERGGFSKRILLLEVQE